MKALTLQRTSAAKAGWIIGLIFFAWLAFLFVPVPRSRTKEVTPVVLLAPSKLRVAGLKDNPDWDGLPELFAIWSDSAEWKDDKTHFAYWNPGSNSYSYFFEANRENGDVRFRQISKTELSNMDAIFFNDVQEMSEVNHLKVAVPTHPFVFPDKMVPAKDGFGFPRSVPPKPEHFSTGQSPSEVDIRVVPLELPKVRIQNPALPDGSKKK
jgi:hypothetical protein